MLSFRTGYSPESMLHHAVSDKRLDLLDYLLARGADVEMSGEDGKTPLMTALSHNMVDMTILLIDLGADVNFPGHGGYHPAHAVVA